MLKKHRWLGWSFFSYQAWYPESGKNIAVLSDYGVLLKFESISYAQLLKRTVFVTALVPKIILRYPCIYWQISQQ